MNYYKLMYVSDNMMVHKSQEFFAACSLHKSWLQVVLFAFLFMGLGGPPGVLADGWVAVGTNGTILNSQDGLTWTEATSPTTETLRGLGFDGNGTWVASGQSGTVISSSNGQNWTVQPSGNTDALWGTVFEGGQWIVTGGQGRIITSPDGAVWTSVNGRFGFTLYDIAYDETTLYSIAGDAGFASTVLTSFDAVTWTQEPPTPNNGEGLYGAAYGEGNWVAVGDKGTILTGSDPTSRAWVEQASGTDIDLRDIVYNGNGLFIVVGRDGIILTSSDAATWTQRTSGTVFDLWGVAYDGSGQYIIVGDEGVILSSSDGFNWIAANSPTFRWLYDVASGRMTGPPQPPLGPVSVPAAGWPYYLGLISLIASLAIFGLRQGR